MKLFAFALISGALALCGVRADVGDDAIVAAMNTSSAANYTWTATIEQNGHSAEIRGKTNNGGYSLITFVGFTPASVVARGGSGTTPSSGTNTVFLGDSKYVVES